MTRRRAAYLALSLAVLPILSSCLTPTGKQKPVGVVSYGARSGGGSTGMHTVLKADTVYTVAQRYNLPLRDIIAVNNLSAPYKLPPGYRLKLPRPNEYTVRPGDTLNGISRMFDASVSEIARLNNMSDPYLLEKGQVVRLPSAQPRLEQTFAENAPSTGAVVAEQLAPMKVASVEAEALAPPPGMESTTSLTPASPSFEPAPAAQAQVTVAPAGFPPQPTPAQPQVLETAPAKVQTAAATTAAIAPKIPARSGSGRFMRPVDGKVISGFGPKEGGLHNDGINIKAPKGTPVRAAENGVVAYVGSEMAGYGNLVLIKHQDRWITAYAHMDKTLVKKGDVVKAGQSIGTVGSTGGVDSAQLHFEVRKGTQAVNPNSYL